MFSKIAIKKVTVQKFTFKEKVFKARSSIFILLIHNISIRRDLNLSKGLDINSNFYKSFTGIYAVNIFSIIDQHLFIVYDFKS